MTTYTPSPHVATALRGRGQLLPIFRECLADTETPVSAYMKLRAEGPSFLLESVEGGERQGRYSIVATAPGETLTFDGPRAEYRTADGVRELPCSDPLAIVDEILHQRVAVPTEGLPRFHGGAIGYLGFDLIRYYEQVGPEKTPPYD